MRFRKGDVVGHEDKCACALLMVSDEKGALIERCPRARAHGSKIGQEFYSWGHVLLYRRPSRKRKAGR